MDRENLLSNPSSCCALTATRAIPSDDLSSIDAQRLITDWRYQRATTWRIFESLTQPGAENASLLIWQNWFTDDDLEHIFNGLYSDLGKDQRLARAPLTEAAVTKALDLWQSEQRRLPGTEADRLNTWFTDAALRAQGQTSASMERILFNRPALAYMLLHYYDIYLCFKSVERKGCSIFQFPEGSAFIKTAWRRGSDGFQINAFKTDASGIREQLARDQWTPEGTWLPAPGTSLSLTNSGGAVFHLVGLHLTLKFPKHWLWGSLWLSPKGDGPLTRDQPSSLKERWSHYQLCAVHSFASPFSNLESSGWSPDLQEIATLMRDLPSSNWCSNPFLEFGSNNQKTNCIGCHQYAGLDRTQSDLAVQLASDPKALQIESSEPGPSDFVWSLIAGTNPLAIKFADIIEYFDAYDPYE